MNMLFIYYHKGYSFVTKPRIHRRSVYDKLNN